MVIRSLQAAREARDCGINQSLNSAERACADWSEVAYHFLTGFAKYNEFFTGEQVAMASRNKKNFPQPRDERAWGAIYQRAQRDGLIVKSGTAPRHRGHLAIGNVWRSLVFVGGVA